MSETLGELQAQYNELQLEYLTVRLDLLALNTDGFGHLKISSSDPVVAKYVENTGSDSAIECYEHVIVILEVMMSELNERIRSHLERVPATWQPEHIRSKS